MAVTWCACALLVDQHLRAEYAVRVVRSLTGHATEYNECIPSPPFRRADWLRVQSYWATVTNLKTPNAYSADYFFYPLKERGGSIIMGCRGNLHVHA